MTLYEEAPQAALSGLNVYAYGLHIAIGFLAMTAAAIWIAHQKKMKKGTATLFSVLAIVLGGIVSRLFFCIMDQSLGTPVPFSAWFRIDGGGWSMTGLIAGVFLAAWLSARMTGQNSMELLDISACSLPLLIIAERMGDRLIEDFNTSRPLEDGWISRSFLAVQGEYETYLRTYYLAAAAALVLFLILNVMSLRKNRRNGDLWIAFLLICGAMGVLLESLRYDYFLSITFVHLQQVVFALMILAGTVFAAVYAKGRPSALRWAAPLSLIVTVGAVIGIEFAIDRSDINNLLLYAAMILVILIPVVLGLILLQRKELD
ncbi:MAG: prolipoprotein diacylglyceryl transferase [Clostridia bacterium]|nr:prolipoprotein diacylglyceryl transferase [Clostridia bacterium]